MTIVRSFLAGLLSVWAVVAGAQQPLVHLDVKGEKAEGGKLLDMEFTEVERRPDASVVQTSFRSGGSVSSSMFILRGTCAIAEARGYPYFKTTRLPAPEGRYIVTLQHTPPDASDAAPAGAVFSVSQCQSLGF